MRQFIMRRFFLPILNFSVLRLDSLGRTDLRDTFNKYIYTDHFVVKDLIILMMLNMVSHIEGKT